MCKRICNAFPNQFSKKQTITNTNMLMNEANDTAITVRGE